jgi:hypothetical protein
MYTHKNLQIYIYADIQTPQIGSLSLMKINSLVLERKLVDKHNFPVSSLRTFSEDFPGDPRNVPMP